MRAAMADVAIRAMSLDDFLCWEDGTDTRYELVGGFRVGRAPPAPAHGILSVRLGGAIDAALRLRRPCTAQNKATIAIPDRNDACYVADLATTCVPFRHDDRVIREPVL